MLIVVALLSLCNGSTATGGSTAQTDFLESCEFQGCTGNDLLKEVMGLEITKNCSVCMEAGERRWTNTNISEIYILWKEAGGTDKHGKIRKKLLPNVNDIKISAIQFLSCFSTKVKAQHCRMFNQKLFYSVNTFTWDINTPTK